MHVQCSDHSKESFSRNRNVDTSGRMRGDGQRACEVSYYSRDRQILPVGRARSWKVYSLLTARAPDTFATSFCKRAGLAALRAPTAAFDTALRIMAGRVKRDGRERIRSVAVRWLYARARFKCAYVHIHTRRVRFKCEREKRERERGIINIINNKWLERRSGTAKARLVSYSFY